jgi:hypothetical protein
MLNKVKSAKKSHSLFSRSDMSVAVQNRSMQPGWQCENNATKVLKMSNVCYYNKKILYLCIPKRLSQNSVKKTYNRP